MLVAGSWSREGGEEAGHDRTKAHRKLNFEGFQVAGRSGHAPPRQPRTGGGKKSRCQRTVTHAARKTPPPPARQRQRPRRPSRGRPQAEPAEHSVLLYIGTYIASDIIKKKHAAALPLSVKCAKSRTAEDAKKRTEKVRSGANDFPLSELILADASQSGLRVRSGHGFG